MKGLKKLSSINKVGLIWIITWIVIFLLDSLFGLQDLLCCKGMNLLDGEYYRVFTGLLLHMNVIHLLVNMITMYFMCEFINGKMNTYMVFVLSIIMGSCTNAIFLCLYPQSSYIAGGSPMIFALIGVLIVLQWKRKDLPRFRLGTWYGNWIVGYAVLSNIPVFSKGIGTLVVHMLGAAIGMLFGFLGIKKDII